MISNGLLMPPHTLSKPHMRHSFQSLLKECGWLLLMSKFFFADPEKTLLLPTHKDQTQISDSVDNRVSKRDWRKKHYRQQNVCSMVAEHQGMKYIYFIKFAHVDRTLLR